MNSTREDGQIFLHPKLTGADYHPGRAEGGVVTRQALIAAIGKVVRDERDYAAVLLRRGDLGRAKLALAAIGEVEAALAAADRGEAATYAARLDEDLRERRREFQSLWDDEDGVGGSTFLRVLDLVEGAA